MNESIITCPDCKSMNVCDGIIWWDNEKKKNIKVEQTVDVIMAIAMRSHINPNFGQWCKSCNNFFYLGED